LADIFYPLLVIRILAKFRISASPRLTRGHSLGAAAEATTEPLVQFTTSSNFPKMLL